MILHELNYGLDDDERAIKVIGYVVNRGEGLGGRLWGLVTTPERIEQTCRVLIVMKMNAQAQYSAKSATLKSAEIDWLQNKSDKDRRLHYLTVQRENAEWRARMSRFTQSLEAHMADAKRIQKVHYTAFRNENVTEQLWDTLIVLVRAVVNHREKVTAEYDPTPEDSALWARLDILEVPGKGTSISKLANHPER